MKGFAIGLLNFLLFLSLAALGIALTLHCTILNPDFITSELDKVDPYPLVKEQLIGQLPLEQISQETEFIGEAIDATIVDLEPWLKEQVRNGVYSGYDYLTGKSESWSLVISTEPLKESLRDNLREVIQQSPPPELTGASTAELEQYFNELYEQEISQQIPPTFEFDESSLPPETMRIIEQVRRAVSYAEIAFRGLIALTIVLIAGIILINRQVRASTRKIGITFTTYGAIWYGGIFAAKHFAMPQLARLGLPTQLQEWLPQLLNDVLVPLQMFSLGFLVAGIALLIVSHVYKPRQPSFESESPE